MDERGTTAPKAGTCRLVAVVQDFRERLADGSLTDGGATDVAALSDADRIDLLRTLEELTGTVRAVQAEVTVAFDASQRAEQATAGVRADRQSRGIGAQVGMARRDSPHRGSRHVGLARTLLSELPHTYAALRAGVLTEWRATIVARETAVLTAEDRANVDRVVCADLAGLDGLGDKKLEARVRRLAYRLDPAAAVRRAGKAAEDRRVSVRPAPDVMSQVSALLPAAQGVAVYAALKRAADSAMAGGDDRSRSQVMADTLVERVTGQSSADATPVAVDLVIPADALLSQGADPHAAPELIGYGPVPAGWARDLIRTAAATAGEPAASWLRRVFADPVTGELVAMDSRQRSFPAGLEHLIAIRDAGICRTPWCGAPIRHQDHVVPAVDGGETSAANGQGLCAQCNHAKQAPGWEARPVAGGPRHQVVTSTPTGHTYRSTAPPLPGSRPHRMDVAWTVEDRLRLILAA